MKSRLRASCRTLEVRSVSLRFRRGRRLDLTGRFPSAVDLLQARLLARALNAFPEPHFSGPIRRAAREALLLTEKTGYALLLLPELFAELAIASMLKAEYHRLGRI